MLSFLFQALNKENIQTQLDDSITNYLSRNVKIIEEEKVSEVTISHQLGGVCIIVVNSINGQFLTKIALRYDV